MADTIQIDVNAAGGGKVLLLEGTYTIDGTISLLDDVEIIGSGTEATIITIANSFDTTIDFNMHIVLTDFAQGMHFGDFMQYARNKTLSAKAWVNGH